MGVAVELTLFTDSKEHAERAAKAAYLRFSELDSIMSDYQKNSELNRLAASPVGTPVRVSPDLFRVLNRSLELARLTDGAFDITAGPIIRRWRRVRDDRVLPTQAEVDALRAATGWRKVMLDADGATVTLTGSDLKLDLGGIAKGYACDAALAVLRDQGVGQAMVEAGGDIALGDPPPDHAFWTISVLGWQAPLHLRNCGISTSGNAEQYVDIGGKRFSHIVDPRTGWALTTPLQVTVIARNAFVTDGLSTACSVLGDTQASHRLLRRFAATGLFLD